MKKILIVDDEQDIVESLKFVLEVSGYVCYTAYNGEDGLRLAKELVPAIVVKSFKLIICYIIFVMYNIIVF